MGKKQSNSNIIKKFNTAIEDELRNKLSNINKFPLLGIKNDDSLETLIKQIKESHKRVYYLNQIGVRNWDEVYCDPNSSDFNPLKAAVYQYNNGNSDEAFWLVFLATHFGRNRVSSWGLTRLIYGKLGDNEYWSWDQIKSNYSDFETWLITNNQKIRNHTPKCGFGNHRKRESVLPDKTGRTFVSYIQWVNRFPSHQSMFDKAFKINKQNPYKTFDYLFNSMRCVHRFGRTACFDYLTMCDNLGFLNIIPPSAYLHDATGPKKGAKLLFFGEKSVEVNIDKLDVMLIDFSNEVNLDIRIVEDAICNWQKNPDKFVKFRG